MKLGYARVSTADQSLDLQRSALEAAGCDKIFEDHGMSGTRTDRPGYCELLETIQPGDTLVVWRLDRLARSLLQLVDTVTSLHNRGIGFHSICEYIDISSAYGEYVLHILSATAHFERALIVERTRAGMLAAKQRGVKFGRKPLDGEALREALYLIKRGMPVPKAAEQIGVAQSTLYRHIADLKSMPGYLAA